MQRLDAVQYVRRMRGSSQSHLMRASDDKYYIVKVQNNPQGVRVLANEMLGTCLARKLGLPAPKVAIINVSENLIRYSENAVIGLERGSVPCQAGLCCGSRFNAHGFIFLPNFFPLEGLQNWRDIFGMLAFDKWTSNSDRRQLFFYRQDATELLRVGMIDQGDCFCRDKWRFLDNLTVGLTDSRELYCKASCLEDFEPWLFRLEHRINLSTLRRIAQEIPPEWYEHDAAALDALLVQLDQRRTAVRGLLEQTLLSRADYFPRANFRGAVSNSHLVPKETSRCSQEREKFGLRPIIHANAR